MDSANSVFQEFKQFILRGNVLDLAVGIVIGAAFTAVINSLVADLLMPVIAMIFGEPDFSALDFTINEAVFRWGAFVTSLITFLMIAAAVFFFVVKPANMLIERAKSEPPADPTAKKCGQCLSEIPIEATRCAFCTQPV
jgi:large conductance mechanosensitive channel